MVKICFNLARFMFKVIFFYFHASENLFLWNEEKPFSIKLEVNALANTFPLLRFFFFISVRYWIHIMSVSFFLNYSPSSRTSFPLPKILNFSFQIYSQRIFEKGERGSLNAATTLSLPGSLTPGAIAIDFIANNIYVVDILGEKIDVFELGGNFHAIVLSNNVTHPQDISLDPYLGLASWVFFYWV